MLRCELKVLTIVRLINNFFLHLFMYTFGKHTQKIEKTVAAFWHAPKEIIASTFLKM
jgi:hypothetical protein